MKRFILLVLLCLSFCLKVFSQELSLYNTGTLYESFENPAVRAFIPDSSRSIAFNFFAPNGGANVFLTGDAQTTLKSRAFNGNYTDGLAALPIGPGRYNNLYANANVYLIMLKIFTSLNGDQEMGFSVQTKGEAHGMFTDESIAVLNGAGAFPGNTYNNVFNDHYYYQMYHEIGFSYRVRVNDQLAIGFKLASVLGISYSGLDVISSQIQFDKPTNSALLGLAGVQTSSYVPGKFDSHDLLPTFRNPGAALSMGLQFKTRDGFVLQGNLKDLGFIHWSDLSTAYVFNNTAQITGLSSEKRETNMYNGVYNIIHTGDQAVGSFTTSTDSRVELSASKSFPLDDYGDFKYLPTLVASKQLFDIGFSAAMINRVQMNQYNVALIPSYDNFKNFNVGAQFMIKTPDVDFFIGSDSFIPTSRFVLAAQGNTGQIEHTSPNTTANIYLGFSLKFGTVVEHPMDASNIPMGEKDFFGRLWNRIFKTYR